ncbi:MAG: TIGR03086 family metal-binding protein [Jiangellaceae bacterium]
MDVVALFGRSCWEFDRRVAEIGADQWALDTPCTEWNVRTLVNHVTVEDLWVPPLLRGATIGKIGDRFDGDQLGDDPKAAWRTAYDEAVRAAGGLPSVESPVHLSFGDFPASFYLTQLIFDHVVHGWDLATAIGADTRLDPELVDFSVDEFVIQEDSYRASGAIAERPSIPAKADAQTRLLAMFGRAA